MKHLTDDRGVIETPTSPSLAEWNAMGPADRARVVRELSAGMPEDEVSPPEGDAHSTPKREAFDALDGFFKRQSRSVYLATELPIYYPDTRRFAPDLIAVLDVPTHPRDSWIVVREGHGLDFALEIHTGGDRKKDEVENVARYAQLGIPEYFIYDTPQKRLLGYRLPHGQARQYQRILPQSGNYHSQVLGLDLYLVGDRLRFSFAGAPVPLSMDLIRQLQDRLEAEADVREEVARKLEEERRRREEETRRREEAESRVAALEAELARLREPR